jgi:hypothetical protein
MCAAYPWLIGGLHSARNNQPSNILAAENLGLATSPPYLALSSSSNPNYANGVNFASGGAGVSNATNKVRQSPTAICI